MRNFTTLLFIILQSLVLSAEKTCSSMFLSSLNIPEEGIYMSYNMNSNLQYQNQFDTRTKQLELKLMPTLQVTPSAFGRLQINTDGSFEFLDFKKKGTYKFDETSRKIKFTGYLEGAEGLFQIQRGTCILVISIKSADGSLNSIQYEKPSAYVQPDIKNANGPFQGIIVNSLVNTSTDYIDIATSKALHTYTSKAFAVAGISPYTVHIFKDNYLNDNEIYAHVVLLDKQGTQIVKYKGASADGQKWAIGNYWYGSPSPDGSKIVLTGKYMLHSGFLDPNYQQPFPIISIIDAKTGKELKWFECDVQNAWGASWLPNGDLIMPKKGGGINIVDANLAKVKTIYNNPVIEARVSINNKVLYAAGSSLFTMDMDGTNIKQLQSTQINLTTANLSDCTWSPDGKSVAIVYKHNFLQEYFILMMRLEDNTLSYLNDSKGDMLRLKSPFISWLGL